jgi:hypothetical protein
MEGRPGHWAGGRRDEVEPTILDKLVSHGAAETIYDLG